MNWRSFVASLANSIAWPVAVVVLSLVFRSNISRWVTDLMNRSSGEVEVGTSGIRARWDNKVEEAKIEAEPLVKEQEQDVAEASVKRLFLDEMEEVAKIAPTAAVTESFRRLELQLRELVDLSRIDAPMRAVGRRLGQIAADAGILSPREFALFADLVTLRNTAAHEVRAIDRDGALGYVSVASTLYAEWARRIEGEDWEPPDR